MEHNKLDKHNCVLSNLSYPVHISKIGYLHALSLRNTRHHGDCISEPDAKFDANHWRIVDDIIRQCSNQN